MTGTMTETRHDGQTPRQDAKPTLPSSPGPKGRTHRNGFVAYEIEVDRIEPDPEHARGDCDQEGLERLARSMATHGQIQPITVRHGSEPFRYVIVTGERRWRAAVLAGLTKIAAVVIDAAKVGLQRLELQLIENLLREDLPPLDQAVAFRNLMERNGWSARELAGVLNVHGTTVSRSLALLELPDAVLDEVDAGRLAPSVAYELTKFRDPDQQTTLADRVVSEGLSRAEAVAAVRTLTARPGVPAAAPASTVTRHIFETKRGRVIVELDGEGGLDELVEEFVEASQAIKAKLEARATSASEPAPAAGRVPAPAPARPEPKRDVAGVGTPPSGTPGAGLIDTSRVRSTDPGHPEPEPDPRFESETPSLAQLGAPSSVSLTGSGAGPYDGQLSTRDRGGSGRG